MKNADKPINPITRSCQQEEDDFVNKWTPLIGLTKREYFAGLAMQGLITGRWACPDNVPNDVITIVKEAVLHADELLKQLENK